jgi:hypothetical protein
MVPAARKTITTALATLTRCGLVEQRDREWWACEPTDQANKWFKARDTESQDWHQSWAYWPCAIPTPECPLTSVGVGIYWVLKALKKWDRPTTITGLAGFLGVDGRAVYRPFLGYLWTPATGNSLDRIAIPAKTKNLRDDETTPVPMHPPPTGLSSSGPCSSPPPSG